MAIKRLFKCSIQSCAYIFKSGKAAYFIRGKYATDFPEEIAELENEVRLGHPHITIDPNEREIDTEADPLAGLKAKMRAEILQEIAEKEKAVTQLDNDMGTSNQGRLNPGSTTDIAPVSAGGDATQLQGRLKGLLEARNVQGEHDSAAAQAESEQRKITEQGTTVKVTSPNPVMEGDNKPPLPHLSTLRAPGGVSNPGNSPGKDK